jgi:hypothetical protein
VLRLRGSRLVVEADRHQTIGVLSGQPDNRAGVEVGEAIDDRPILGHHVWIVGQRLGQGVVQASCALGRCGLETGAARQGGLVQVAGEPADGHPAAGHLGRSLARGSVDSPGAVNVVAPCEAVLVAHKGEWGRPPGIGTRDLSHEEWLSWCNGDWAIPGEGRPWEGFEAAFPAELPRRLLKLFSFREDMVCDPFLGSGTTAVVAYQLGRACLGFDVDPLQVASASRRLAVIARR